MKQKKLRGLYKILKPEIEKRLGKFKSIWKTRDNVKLFSEFCFCLLTPQSRARTCWMAVVDLKKKDFLFNGSVRDIKGCLVGVRFKNHKTGYIITARKQFAKTKKEIRDHKNVFKLRDWLVANVCGMGFKEASHFLRNTGLGADIAILDRHILRNLKFLGVIREVPASILRRKYLEIEGKMRRFSQKSKIPLAHLDLLLWAKETGGIFK